ncbi:MAG: hypothetical protein E7437_04060 [Ruminococcaceae bacterium]|nr:hypothetical protein [Oscillospiraceae bacterium]
MKKINKIISLLLLVALLAGCGDTSGETSAPATETTEVTTEATTEATEPTQIVTVPTEPVVEGPEADFEILGNDPMDIVYEYGLVDQLVYECRQLGVQVTTEGYTPVQVYNDWEEDLSKVVHDQREILVGLTNRKASIDLAETLEDNQFAVKVTENQILITGKDQMATHYAIRYFRDEVLTAATIKTGKGTYQIPTVEYVGTVPDMTLAELIATGENIVQICTEVGRLDGITGFNRVEGGCSDGTYIYQSHDTPDLSQVIISKTEIATMKRVAVSEPMDVATADDMTYYNGELFLTKPGNESVPTVAVVDAETLTFKEFRDFTGEYAVGSVHYEPTREQFASRVNGTNIGIYDKDMNFIKLVSPGNVMDMTGQGCVADENYVYQNWWDELRREAVHDAITICDWEGNFLAHTTAYWDNSMADMEPKTVYMINGELYGMWIDWAQGMFVYKIDFALA